MKYSRYCMNKNLFILLLLPFTLFAKIIESDDIRTVMNYVYDTHHHKDILVVFDIDNTIGHIKDGFGGDEWFRALFQKRLLSGEPIHVALAEVLALYFPIQKTLWLDPVQEETPKLIQFLQDVGIATMALTSRSLPIKERTLVQLDRINIDFTRCSPFEKDIDLSRTNEKHLQAIYQKGVLFSAENDKGELLIHFFNTVNYHPQKVIFIDDKLKYVEQLERAMKTADIPYIGIRYSKLDEKVASYRLEDHADRLKTFFAA